MRIHRPFEDRTRQVRTKTIKMAMNRLYFTTFQLIGIFLFVWPSPTLGAELTVDQKLQLLKENFETKIAQLEKKNAQLEAKVTRLESSKENQFEILERKIHQLEVVLQNEKKTNQVNGKSATPRTCREVRDSNPTLTSGMYWIDPDGQGVGDAPISVYCNMTTGSTSVTHDSESSINVGHCADPGCYSRAINYDASSRQIKALAEMSAECHQSIQYDCYFAPLEFNTVPYSWWNDKSGNAQYFWAGSNSTVHTCQCGIDGNCVDPGVNCNCDSAAPIQLTDYGVITKKDILPISRLNFGRTQLDTSSGVHILGRYECSGQVAVTGMPKSCEDLWRIGHTLSGLYSVMGLEMIESVYCDFTKLPGDSGLQTWIGYDDVKSSPTYFYVQRSSNIFNQTNVPIPFDVERLNVGGAMNSASGKFTAPVAGKYFFSLSGLTDIPASSGRLGLQISLYKNGGVIANSYTDAISSGAQRETFSLQSTLELKSGDQIWLQITEIASGPWLWGNYYTHFNGFLLQENISQVVKTLQ